MNEKKIARIAYEVCREYDKMRRRTDAVSWKDAPQATKDIALEMVRDNIAASHITCDDTPVNVVFRAVVLALTNEESQ